MVQRQARLAADIMIRGWDNTGANGANLSFPQEFGIADRHWLIGVINASPTLFGLLSAWAADPVNNALGRRGTIFATNIFVVFPVLAQGFTQNWWGLMLCRLFMGLGMGIKVSRLRCIRRDRAVTKQVDLHDSRLQRRSLTRIYSRWHRH
jgi:MFS family permease